MPLRRCELCKQSAICVFTLAAVLVKMLLMRFYGLSAAETAASLYLHRTCYFTESMNTAVEAAVDMACKDKNPLAKKG